MYKINEIRVDLFKTEYMCDIWIDKCCMELHKEIENNNKLF